MDPPDSADTRDQPAEVEPPAAAGFARRVPREEILGGEGDARAEPQAPPRQQLSFCYSLHGFCPTDPCMRYAPGTKFKFVCPSSKQPRETEIVYILKGCLSNRQDEYTLVVILGAAICDECASEIFPGFFTEALDDDPSAAELVVSTILSCSKEHAGFLPLDSKQFFNPSRLKERVLKNFLLKVNEREAALLEFLTMMGDEYVSYCSPVFSSFRRAIRVSSYSNPLNTATLFQRFERYLTATGVCWMIEQAPVVGVSDLSEYMLVRELLRGN